MRYKILSIVTIVFAAFLISCEGMYDNMEKYYGEVVYPAKYDTIIGSIGYKRVEIDLMKAGRIPSSEIKMGKAVKTIIEYDEERIEINNLVSWVNIENLTQAKLYRFYIFTEDEFGNESVPQEIALIPFTSSDLDNVVVTNPRIQTSPTSAIVEWPNGLNSILMNYHSLSYSYTDKDGVVRSGESTEADGGNPRLFLGNLESGTTAQLKITYLITPKQSSIAIIDKVELERTIEIPIPGGSTPFTPSEREILQANGITTFTADALSSVTKLTLPLHIGTFADLFYFSNLEELDLTGAGLSNIVPALTLNGNGNTYVVGGCDWQPYLRRIEYTDVLEANIGSKQSLLDLLESGILKKITYIKNSMGLDDILAPYIESGVVELVSDDWFPQEVTLDPKFLHAGQLQTSGFQVAMTFPASSSEIPLPGSLTDAVNVLKVEAQANSATFSYTLPAEYMYDFERYRYLKYKVYIKGDNASIDSELKGDGGYGYYRRIWPRIRYSFWGNDQGNNPYGAGDDWEWKPSDRAMYLIPAANVNAAWTEITVDMKQVTDKIKAQNHSETWNPRSGHYHSRNICYSLSGESSPGYSSDKPVYYYFADVRMSQTP